MSSAIITLIIWAPFILLAFCFGLGFGIHGYKKGTLKAGVSVLATLAAAVLSVIAARLLSSVLAPLLVGLVKRLAADSPEFAHLMQKEYFSALISGAATALGALLLFVPLLILLLVVFRLITSAVGGKKNTYHSAGSKVGGLLIGLLDALLVAFLLLLPLYGTLGIGGDLYASVSAISDLQNESHTAAAETRTAALSAHGSYAGIGLDQNFWEDPEVLKTLNDVPLLRLAQTPPFSTAYDSLASFDYKGTDVSLSEILKTVSSMLKAYSSSFRENPEEANKLLSQAIQSLKSLTVKSGFFAGLLSDVLPELIPADSPLLADYAGLTDSAVLQQDLPALLDVAQSLAENGIFAEVIQNGLGNLNGMPLGTFPEDLAKALNSTDSLASLKASVLNNAVAAAASGLSGDEAKKEALINALGPIPSEPLTGDDLRAEGESFLLILKASAELSEPEENGADLETIAALVEGFARHPAIGTESAAEAMSVLLDRNTDDPLIQALNEQLSASQTKPAGSFSDVVNAAMNATTAFSAVMQPDAQETFDPESEETVGAMQGLLQTDPNTLAQMARMLSDEVLVALGADKAMAAKAEIIVRTVSDVIAASHYTAEESEREAAALNYLLTTLVNAAKKSDAETLTGMIPEPEKLLDVYLSSDTCMRTVAALTADTQSDPFDLFGGIPAAAKTELADLLNQKAQANPEKASALNSFARLIGITF